VTVAHPVRIDFSQSFIQHAYIELHMPPDPTKPGGYAMDANHLHIWPRHSFMLIGLPNKVSFRRVYHRQDRLELTRQDGSFTLTLFLPFSSLSTLDTRPAAEAFFRENFPSAVDIVGIKPLVDDFENNPRGNLVTTHVSVLHILHSLQQLIGQVLPTVWSSHAVLLGDASHSMVPYVNHFHPGKPR
jgi:kynurenine 3-monooxygenase